jgi:hypothetical protein
MKKQEIPLLKLLTLFARLTHSAKSERWPEKDRNEFYSLKDDFLKTLIKDKFRELLIRLYYIPYYRYSTATKDKAGKLMREDNSRMPFEYYLSLIEPGDNDIEIKDKATVEMVVEFLDTEWSFHIQATKIAEWGINIDNMPKKVWVSEKEYRQIKLKELKKALKDL